MQRIYLLSLLTLLVFAACEKQVDLELETAETALVVDAWITDQARPQQISLTYTQGYFDNTVPEPARDAVVTVIETETGNEFSFTDPDNNGVYEWMPPAPDQTFGTVGRSYALTIELGGITYGSFTRMNGVPAIDSITFEYYKKGSFSRDEYYIADFWSRDLPGVGNAYWIKTWKNANYLGQPTEINIAYDAGFSPGGEVDSLIFIQPIRNQANPFDAEQDGLLLPPYSPGDSIRVQIHSISPEAWFFLYRMTDEINRPGGFGELFSTPLANIPTNILASDERPVVGFFNVAAVAEASAEVSEETIRDNLPD